MLAKLPGFTLAAVVCLALGIGTTAAMYSQIRSSVFRPLPGVESTSELVRLQRPTAFANYEEFRDRSGQFSSAAAYLGPVPLVVGEPGGSKQRVWGHVATPNYFEVLGTKLALDRVFDSEDRTRGASSVTVLGYRLWETRFGADPSIVGRSIRVNGQPVSVIGIAAQGFLGASPTTSAADL